MSGFHLTKRMLQQKLANAMVLTPAYKSFVHIRSKQRYIVQGVVLNESTLDPWVIYKPANVDGISWARPQKDFLEKFQ
jgi:hypothetical protein